MVPGSIHTDRHNCPTPEEAPWPDQVTLRDFLDELGDAYDVTLIDNPPNLHLCSWTALAASGWVLIPVQPEDYGRRGSPPYGGRSAGCGPPSTPAFACSVT